MQKITKYVALIGSVFALIISMGLFRNLGVFVDEEGLSPVDVYGGEFWLYMSWLRLVILLFVILALVFNILVPRENNVGVDEHVIEKTNTGIKVLLSIILLIGGVMIIMLTILSPLSIIGFGVLGLVTFILGIIGCKRYI